MQEDAIVELEIRIAYQDRKIEHLDQMVRGLVTRLETAERELKEIKQAMTPTELVDEKPPHY